MQDEIGLQRRLLRRDPAVLDDLTAAYGGQMERLASLVLGPLGTAEDSEEIVSDALVAAWGRAAEFDPSRTALKSWLLMLTKYAALDHRRRLQRRRLTPLGAPRLVPLESVPEPVESSTPESAVLRSDQHAELRRALDRLPESERDLLIRRYLLEEPVAALGDALGLTRSAIDTRLSRARQALRRLLKEEEADGRSAI